MRELWGRVIRPGRLPERQGVVDNCDTPENIRRCKSCDVPVELCLGTCTSDKDQEQRRKARLSNTKRL